MGRTLIIAEAGVNHNGSIKTAKELIKKASEAGADYVKFQTFLADKLVSKEAEKAAYQSKNTDNDESDSQYQMLKKLELSYDDHYELVDYCNDHNIKFLSTAFDLDSIDFLMKLGLDFYKIPSGEITNRPYLEKVADLGLPVILSTGMSNMQEVEDAVKVLVDGGITKEKITVLHCNTEYPTPLKDVNLRAMNTIKEKLGVEIGYSDHTLGIIVPVSAVSLGAKVIEKHFTLDKNMEGPDHKASLDPEELKEMVNKIREVETLLGSDLKAPSPSEKKNIAIARKSIHISKNLNQGHTLEFNDLIMKRPGDGISPMKIDEVLGKKIKRNLASDYKLSFSDLEND